MHTIKHIQSQLKLFDSKAKHASTEHEISQLWKNIFHEPINSKSAKSFLGYYKEMRSKPTKTQRSKTAKRRRMQGGSPAPNN